MQKVQRRTWIWHFDSPPERVWPLLADTARFDEAAGLPKNDIEEIPQVDGSVVYLGRARFLQERGALKPALAAQRKIGELNAALGDQGIA